MSPVQVLPGAEGGWWSGKAGPGAKRPAPWSQLWQAEQLCSLSFLSLRLVNLEYSHWRFFKNNIFTYLASPGFSWGTRDLPCRMPSLSCGKWDPVPWAGMEPKPPALGAQNLSHRTTREMPYLTEYWPVYIVNRFTYRTLQIWKLSVAKKTSCQYLFVLRRTLDF